VRLVQNSEDLKNLPSWVESVNQIVNNLSRGFDDDREEAKWEKKKADLVAKVPDVKKLFDVWRRDKEISNRIVKRSKAEKSLGREYNAEMVECGSRLGIEVIRRHWHV
jgi:hypothetical protein